VAPGRAKVSMVCRPERANILGLVHGTALFALIDEAFQAAVATYFIEVTDPEGGLVVSCQALAYRKDQPLPFAAGGGK
jgi:acyl-CoA thioesterase